MSDNKPLFVSWDENDPKSKEFALTQASYVDSLHHKAKAGGAYQNVTTKCFYQRIF
jgi:hypothetical protein